MSRGTAGTQVQFRPQRTRDTFVITEMGGRADPAADVLDIPSATAIATRGDRLKAYMLPFAIVAALAVPVPLRNVRRHQLVGAATEMIEIAWDQVEDDWEPTQELITNEQVRALNALLAIPYTNDSELDYLADE